MISISQNDDGAVVSVKDFGIGVAKVHHEKIFDRFYRVYDTMDKTYPGLGMGLYISHEIMRMHGGKMWVESRHGHGSEFSFSIPHHFPASGNGEVLRKFPRRGKVT